MRQINTQKQTLSSKFWPKRVPYNLPIPQTSLWENLQISASRYPDKPAYIFFSKVYSYRQILEEAEKIAAWLQKKKIKKGDKVAIIMQNCPQYIIAFYGILRLGAVVVPINPMSQESELEHYFIDSEAKACICMADLLGPLEKVLKNSSKIFLEHVLVTHYSDAMPSRDNLPSLEKPKPEIEAWLYQTIDVSESFDLWSTVIKQEFNLEAPTIAPEDFALLPYTSGTTGYPKGCIHTHQTLMANAAAGVWNQSNPAVVSLAVMPFFHIAGLLSSILLAVFNATCSVIMPRWDKDLAARLINQYQVSHWACIPTMVADVLGSADYSAFGFASLQYISGGGTAMPKALAERLKKEFDLDFIEAYGLTETVASTHMNPPDRPKKQCLGIPMFNVDSRIIDPDTLEELPQGQIGEIITSGPTVFKGYWKNEQATQEAFLNRDNKTFFRTGDLGYQDEDGYFFMADRIKRMINASGYKVWPAEVELILYQHSAIKEACVIGVQEAYRGETVKAIIVLKESHKNQITEEDIITWAREHMAVYKVPRTIEFRNSLPKSGSGKIMWKQLQDEAVNTKTKQQNN